MSNDASKVIPVLSVMLLSELLVNVALASELLVTELLVTELLVNITVGSELLVIIAIDSELETKKIVTYGSLDSALYTGNKYNNTQR